VSSPPEDPDTDAGPDTTTERWIYGGIRVLDGKRVHAWIDPGGRELLYAHKRAGNWAIGSSYTAQVIRTGPSTALYGTPTYTGNGDTPDELRRELWANHLAARTRLSDLTQERKAAQRNAIDEALRPLLAAARTVKTSADRDALIAYVMRQLITAWHAPNPER
jgi:hypothetical protein